MIHEVKSGDTLFQIAKRYNITAETIRKLNSLKTDALALGQKLVVAGATTTAATSTPKTSAPTSSVPSSSAAKPFSLTMPGGIASSRVANPTAQEIQSVQKQLSIIFAMQTALDAPNNRTKYTLQFKDHNMQLRTVVFHDSVKSAFSDPSYTKGVSYVGNQIHKIPASYYQSLGVSPKLARILEFVSTHEGNFDSINSYDKAIFSWGFVQFAGGGRTFHTLLALMKYRNPDLFFDAFQRFGIDVEYSYANERFDPATTRITTIVPSANTILRGVDAEKHIRDNKLLHGVFIRAGHDPDIAKLQVMMATYEFINPVLRRQITVPIAGVPTKVFIADIIRSDAGLAALIDMAINKGVGGACETLFSPVIAEVGRQQGLLDNLEEVRQISDKAILDLIIQRNAKDPRVTKRVSDALAHFSSAK